MANKKIEDLHNIIKRMGSVVVAYSGGLDSSFLLKSAIDALGRENVIAVTARSETYPVSEYKEAASLAKKLGARHITIDTSELKIKNFKDNPVDRCYYCKKELFNKLNAIKVRFGMKYLLDGANYDDLKDVRHGMRAAGEAGVRSPLLESRMTKDDIRRQSKKLKLPTWDKPSFACLASRFPFHTNISAKGLLRVGEAEDSLRKLGFRQIRVRDHKEIARLEVMPSDLAKALSLREAITLRLRKLGFVYVALDLSGYRTGSMHEAE